MGGARFEPVQEAARLRILLVEDDPNDAELVQACLEEAQRGGAQILRAASLADGLRALDEQDVHLVVLDLDLPDSAGFATLERLAPMARGPVIVVTGNPHPRLLDESLKRRAYEVIRKSELDAASLMRIVRLATLQSRTEAIAHRRTEEALESARARARRLSLMYAALSAANEAAARLESEAALYQRICDIAVQFGGMKLAAVRVLNAASGWLDIAGCAGEATAYAQSTRMSADAALPEGRGLAGEAMRENRTTVCNDFLAEPRLAPWHDAARRFGFSTVACVPLRRAGAPFGLLMLYSPDAGWFDAELVTLVERMADNLTHALERLDAQARLRASESRFRSLAGMSSDWFWEQDAQLRFSWSSRDLDGEENATIGQRRWEVPFFRPLSQSWDMHRATLEAHKPFRDFEYLRFDKGRLRYISINGEPVFGDDGAFRGYRGTARDITAGKLAQLRMEHLTRMYAALSSANEAILRASSTRELLERACEVAVQSGDFALGTVFMLDPATGSLHRVAATGRAAAEGEHVRPSIDPRAEGGRGLIGEACRTRAAVVSNDYANDPRAAGQRQERSYRVGSAAVFPLLVDGELAGVFGLLHAEAGAFSVELMALLQRLADNISFGLANFQREVRFRAVVDSANEGILVYDSALNVSAANAAAERILGLSAAELLGKPGFTSVYPCVREDGTPLPPEERPTRVTERTGEALTDYVIGIRRADGAITWLSINTAFLRRPGESGHHGIVSTISDITARRLADGRMQMHAQRQEIVARLGQLALHAGDVGEVFAQAVRALRGAGIDAVAIYEHLANGDYVARAALGEGSEASIDRPAPAAPDSVWRHTRGEHAVMRVDAAYLRSRPADRPWAWSRRMGSAIYATLNRERGSFGVLTAYSLAENAFAAEDERFLEAVANLLSAALRRQETQQRLAYMAEFDALTGLPNRQLLQDRLNQSVLQAQRRGGQGAVLFIDLDRFKLVNDTLGHHLGDVLIREVGRRIRHCVRAGDTVGRVSGDEFGVVLGELVQADDAALVSQKILDALAQPFDLDGHEAYISASVGIAVFPGDGVDADALLKNADMAMYRVKESTRNAHGFFTSEINRRSVAKLQLNTDLRRAIERREFVLHYQPKVNLLDRRVLGWEALLRWNHPTRGMVTPQEFVPALEDSGLILPVGEWVLEEAAAQLARWAREGRSLLPVAVNLSAKQLRRRDLDALIQRTLSAVAMPASLIELEITESALMDDPEEAVRLLRSLRAAGLSLSIDDFGTGYSSLSYLMRLPINALKIDRSFVRDAASASEAASIVRAIIDMAHNLRFTVTAEGVETEAQRSFLRRHGCDVGQGYLFGAPAPASEIFG